MLDRRPAQVFPKNLFLAKLPPSCDILCLHPMFGPESGKASWNGLPLVYDRVRVGDDPARERRCSNFLRAFEAEGCRMVEMTCEEHDKLAASSQFITHTVGRMLGRMALDDTPINTKGYESLLNLVRNTTNDSFDLYYGLFMYNENATEELARMEAAFDAVKRQLFDQLHDVVRQRIFYVRVRCARGVPAPSSEHVTCAICDARRRRRLRAAAAGRATTARRRQRAMPCGDGNACPGVQRACGVSRRLRGCTGRWGGRAGAALAHCRLPSLPSCVLPPQPARLGISSERSWQCAAVARARTRAQRCRPRGAAQSCVQ